MSIQGSCPRTQNSYWTGGYSCLFIPRGLNLSFQAPSRPVWVGSLSVCLCLCLSSSLPCPFLSASLLSLLTLSAFLRPSFSFYLELQRDATQDVLGQAAASDFLRKCKTSLGLGKKLATWPSPPCYKESPFPSRCSRRPSLYPDLSASPASTRLSCFTPLLLQYVAYHLHSFTEFLVSPFNQVFIYFMRTETVSFISPYSLSQMHSL